MQNTRTRYQTSDRLEDTYPYYPEDPRNKAHFVSHVKPDEVAVGFGRRCISKLVSLISNDSLSDERKLQALELLEENIRSHEKRSELIALDGIKACTALLSSPIDDIRRTASHCLRSCFVLRSGRRKEQKTASIAALVTLLQDNQVFVREAAAEAVHTFVSYSDGAEEFCVSYGTLVPSLITPLPDKDGSKVVHQQLLASLKSVASVLRKDLNGGRLCLDAKCERKLVEMAKFEYLSRECAEIACTLCSEDVGKESVIDAGLVPLLASNLDKDDTLRRVSSSALLSLSTVKSGKLAVGDQEVASQLCKCLEDPDEGVRVNCEETVLSASELPSIKDAFIRLLLANKQVSIILHVFGPDCSDILFRRMEELQAERVPAEGKEADPVELLHILEALVELCSEPRKCEQVFDTLNSVESLVEIERTFGGELVGKMSRNIINLMETHVGNPAIRRARRASS